MLIPFSYLFSKYSIPKGIGVLHIGASYGQEAQAYHEEGISKVVFIEAIRDVYESLRKNLMPYGYRAILACVSDKDGDIVTFNISNNEMQSSSLLEFGTHTKEHPGVVFTSKTRLQTTTCKTLLDYHKINAADYQFINLDIQGAELMALRGMDLSNVQYVYIEVNDKELYKGCPLTTDIDDYLNMFDLYRVETKMTPHGWGDAFYIRKKTIRENRVEVPDTFQPKHPFEYPAGNDIDFERWFMYHYTDTTNRVYLPIMWTAFYCRANYGRSSAVKGLQNYLDTLDRSKKYFTIVQYDDGIINDLSGLDIKVFSMSGKPMDYSLPLICKPSKFSPYPKTKFATFTGRITHPIREQLLSTHGIEATSKVKKPLKYYEEIATSIFALCPRGYGPTSFRICEALQYGTIPVYISDEFIEPHGVDFNQYGVKITQGDLPRLKEILDAVDIPAKQYAAQLAYTSIYTYQANLNFIIKTLNNE